MKKFFFTTVAVCALGASALAADLPARVYNKAPVAPAQPVLYAWTGFYVGGHIGGAFSQNNNGFPGFAGFGNNDRFIGGGQVGADYQFSGNFLIGVEGNYSYVDNNNNNAFLFPGGSFSHNIRGLASATGRLGYTWGPALLYFKGGYAYADTRNNGFGAFAANNSRDGYTLGGGLEYMFAQNWSAKIEYQYYRFDNNQLLVGAPLLLVGNFRDEEHTIKLGVNYRFNLAGPLAPVY